jgi:hypothetical protein
LHWKILQFGAFAGLLFLATGCGGLRGKYSVSPLTFLLPGFGRVDTKPTNPTNTELQLDEHSNELAQTERSQIDF